MSKIRKGVPITPDQAPMAHQESIPGEIIDIFNALIIEKIGSTGSAMIMLDDVYARARAAGIDTQEAEEKRWLDVEPLFRQAGWKVEYEQSAYNETGPSFFRFSR